MGVEELQHLVGMVSEVVVGGESCGLEVQPDHLFVGAEVLEVLIDGVPVQHWVVGVLHEHGWDIDLGSARQERASQIGAALLLVEFAGRINEGVVDSHGVELVDSVQGLDRN